MTGAAARAVVVVPAHDEEAWIGACLDALAAQEEVEPHRFAILVVLDACGDGTAGAIASAATRHPDLRVTTIDGPGRGAGRARRVGMDHAAEQLLAAGVPDGLVATTDADSRVAPDWLASQLALVAAGARVVAGRIVLDPAGVPAGTLAARERDAATRLAVVRGLDPDAEHHQCSGASLGLTAATYRAVGGLPDRGALEDEALEARLRRLGIPIARSAAVRVTTAARTDGRAARGLAQALRVEAWAAAAAAASAAAPASAPEPAAAGTASAAGRVRVVVADPRADRPGATLAAALTEAAASDPDVVVVLDGDGGGHDREQAVAALVQGLATPGTLLVQGVPGGVPATDALTELVVRPALNLHAPDLAALHAPLSGCLALRPALLDAAGELPAGDGAVLALVLAAHRRAGLAGLAQVALPDAAGPAAPTPAPAPDGATAYALLAELARHAAGPAEPGTAFVRPTPAGLVTERVDLDLVGLAGSAG